MLRLKLIHVSQIGPNIKGLSGAYLVVVTCVTSTLSLKCHLKKQSSEFQIT